MLGRMGKIGLGLGISGTIHAIIAGGAWLLSGGLWADSGVWSDADVWED